MAGYQTQALATFFEYSQLFQRPVVCSRPVKRQRELVPSCPASSESLLAHKATLL